MRPLLPLARLEVRCYGLGHTAYAARALLVLVVW